MGMHRPCAPLESTRLAPDLCRPRDGGSARRRRHRGPDGGTVDHGARSVGSGLRRNRLGAGGLDGGARRGGYRHALVLHCAPSCRTHDEPARSGRRERYPVLAPRGVDGAHHRRRHRGLSAGDDMTSTTPPVRLRDNLWLLTIAPAIWAVHLLISYISAAVWCAKFAPPGTPLDGIRRAITWYTVVAL